jgi:hypothetical protein
VDGALDRVTDMPREFDLGAAIEELERLRLFVVEPRDLGAMPVPAEKVEPRSRAEKLPRETIGAWRPQRWRIKFRALAARRRVSITAIIEAGLGEYLAENV